MAPRGKILLLHLAGRYPLGGIGWQALHHLIALRTLGWDVWYVEDSGCAPYDPRSQSIVADCAANVAFLADTLERFGFGGRWAYFDLGREEWHGLPAEAVPRLYGEADALLNLCGATGLREEHLACPVRIHVETDPVYPQVRLLAGDPATRAELEAHTHYFTYGENLGQPDCAVPAGDLCGRPTRPPVVVDLWADSGPPGEKLTTVATWRNTGKDVVLRGQSYCWSKHVNFLRFVSLPRETSQLFELALGNLDLEAAELLRRNGWLLADPYEHSRDVEAFRRYVHGSRGEFTVAKDLVARTNSGWFSDRSVCYLAAGRPVITQETGFGKFVPVGEGLFSFTTADEAIAAVETVRHDYARHSRAAQEIAREYFGAERILASLLAECGL
ncbi:MAG: glycosyltransferase [Candidatus Binatia bacterium]